MTKRRITIGITGLLAGVAGAYMLLHSPAAPAQTAPSTLPVVNTVTVQGYTLVRERKISRTVSDLTYRVSVRNTGPALIVVTGTASTSATNVTFVDSGVTLGDIASGTPATSTDTFTIRQNRTRPFRTSQLVWEFRAAPGEGIPPDPGPASNLTLAGIDSDNDGVRDDVERWISTGFATSTRARSALTQRARGLQRELTDASSNGDVAYAIALEGQRAIVCARQIFGSQARIVRSSLESVTLNTADRQRASFAFSERLAGREFTEISSTGASTACDFDPNALSN